MSELVKLLLPEVSISGMFWDFHLTGISVGGGGDDRFLVCSIEGNTIGDQRSSHKQQAPAQCVRETTALPLQQLLRRIRMVLGGRRAPFSHVLTEGISAMVQQLPGHIIARIISEHFAKLNHSGTTK